MRFLFVLLTVLTAGAAQAQSAKASTIIENVGVVLARYGWTDKIKVGATSADGHMVSAKFASADDEKFILDALKTSRNFKESDGVMLKLFHHTAQKSFREQSDPSLHVVLFKDKIEIHFDLHYAGWKHPLESYEHFREVFMNWWHRSSTSQEKVAARLRNKH